MPKVDSAETRLSALNPRVELETVAERVTSANVERLLEDVDVVLDGADNFPVRYLLNDACVKLGKPLVYGAVHRFEGQVSVFDAGRQRGVAPCYRCLFPEPPPPEAAPNCSEAGVLGVLPGVIGMLEATEVLKLLLHVGEPLTGRLLHFASLSMRFRETRLPPDPDCPLRARGGPLPGYLDSPPYCGRARPPPPAPPPPEAAPNCSEAGVLGVLPGVIGMLEATEVLKLLLHVGEPLTGRLLHFDALSMRFRETRLPPDPDCPLCARGRPFPGYIDYAAFCGSA